MARRQGPRTCPGSARIRAVSLNPPKTNGKIPDARQNAAKKNPASKIFVLDTNVLMHDPSCLFRFEEHDVFIPMMTLEELDNHKKGMSEIARNARQVSRILDDLLARAMTPSTTASRCTSRQASWHRDICFCRPKPSVPELPPALPTSKVDNQIPGRGHPPPAQAPQPFGHPGVQRHQYADQGPLPWGCLQRDYFNDKVLEDTDILYRYPRLAQQFLGQARPGMESGKRDSKTFIESRDRCAPICRINEFVWLETDGFAAIVKGSQQQDRSPGNPGRLHPSQECGVGHQPARNRSRISP